MKDPTILARCNLFGVLGSIPQLVALDPDAAFIIEKKYIKVGFCIFDGPEATLVFKGGNVSMHPGAQGASIKLFFPTAEKFNEMMEGKSKPLPISGFQHINFVLHEFSHLTDILSSYLRPTADKLADPVFFARSVALTLCVIGRSAVQIGNHDKVGQFSASNIPDGKIQLSIGGSVSVAIHAQDHHLRFNAEPAAEGVTSHMTFADFEVARDLFKGKINAVSAVGLGQIRVGGVISQVDNLNRILDRVSMYLA